MPNLPIPHLLSDFIPYSSPLFSLPPRHSGYLYSSNLPGPCIHCFLRTGTFFPEIYTCLLPLQLQILLRCHLSEVSLDLSVYINILLAQSYPPPLPCLFFILLWLCNIICMFTFIFIAYLTPLKFKLGGGRDILLKVLLTAVYSQSFFEWMNTAKYFLHFMSPHLDGVCT